LALAFGFLRLSLALDFELFQSLGLGLSLLLELARLALGFLALALCLEPALFLGLALGLDLLETLLLGHALLLQLTSLLADALEFSLAPLGLLLLLELFLVDSRQLLLQLRLGHHCRLHRRRAAGFQEMRA